MEPLPPLSLDTISIWIQNKQLLDQFTSDQLNALQTYIITEIFGGFHCLMKKLLQEPVTLQVAQHLKLHQFMTNHLDQDSITKDSETANQKHNDLSIIDLPDDCLSHTMKFLTHNERRTMQQCCRLFAITARQESSVNDIDTDLPLMYMVPYKRRMIEGFMSNEDDKIMDAFEIHLTYKELIERGEVVENFSTAVFDRFKHLLVEKRCNTTVRRVITGLGINFVRYGVQSYAAEILAEIVNEAKSAIAAPVKQKVDGTEFANMMYSLLCAVELRNEIPHSDGLITVLWDALACYHLFEWEDESQKEGAFSSGCGVFAEILKFGYTQHRQILIDNAFIDKLYSLAETVGMDDEILWCYHILEQYLVHATSQEIDEFMEHMLYTTIVFDKEQQCIPHRDYAYDCILKLIKRANHSQRMQVIELVLDCALEIGAEFRRDVAKLVDVLNDVDAKTQIKQHKYADWFLVD